MAVISIREAIGIIAFFSADTIEFTGCGKTDITPLLKLNNNGAVALRN